MFLLWKTLYRPEGGLINAGLAPALASLESLVLSTPAGLWYASGLALAGLALIWGVWMIAVGVRRVATGDAGPAALLGRAAVVATIVAAALGLAFVLVQLPRESLLPSGRAMLTREQAAQASRDFAAAVPGVDEGALRLAVGGLGERARPRDVIAALVSASGPAGAPDTEALARAAVLALAPHVNEGLTNGTGLRPPRWLVDARWAKIALIIMGFWAGIGGGTMLLYLAGLSNIPPELYEAASIDGATGWQRFIHVTWPQLAPTTFFIVIMSTIGGLQGGFEQAMVMTQGKADTIVLAYYIYNLAFTDQFQLGLASAVAWVMFAMIFALTALNFRLGSTLTND
jgi:multiple sugar transport system permease protein